MHRKTKILFLSADPVNIGPRSRVGEEFREIANRMLIGSEKKAYEIASEFAVRPEDLQEALLKHRPNILHLSVPGAQKGIILEDEVGEFKIVPRDALRKLLEFFKDEIKVVFLNGRCSKPQRAALEGVIDYTIIVNRSLPDDSAIRFASAFYRNLAFGKSVKVAFELSRNDLDIQSLAGTKALELLIKPGVNIDLPLVDLLVAAGAAPT